MAVAVAASLPTMLIAGEGSRLVAGCEILQKRWRVPRELWRVCVSVQDYRELNARDDIDAVFVTTPDA